METGMRRIVIFVVLAAVVCVIAGGIYWYMGRSSGPQSTFRTAPIRLGDLTATISATGTVEPEEVVDVGAQIAGQINFFGKDRNGKSIDYGSEVDEGMLLAQIDDSLYAADVALAKAQLEQAKASQARAEADIGQLQAKLDQAANDWTRAQKLGPSEALAPTSYDAYKATFEISKANLAVGQTAVTQAKAAVDQSQASLDRVQRSLSYCTIKSPVKGVIIDRRVNIGQTVVSSLNAPSLFLIAKDLRRIQVWVPVNEADIGNIRCGMPVTFTVDAFPTRIFRGQVGKVRLNAITTQNVVTYIVEVITDNFDGKLLPYLTANVLFETGRRENVLLVPNAALRWNPRTDQIAPEFRQIAAEAASRPARKLAETQPTTKPSPSPTTECASQVAPEEAPMRHGTLWVKQGDFVKPIKVRTGLTDGSQTEVQSAELSEGMQVITGEQIAVSSSSSASSGGASPFTPQLGRARQPANAGAPGAGGGAGGPGGGAGGPGGR